MSVVGLYSYDSYSILVKLKSCGYDISSSIDDSIIYTYNRMGNFDPVSSSTPVVLFYSWKYMEKLTKEFPYDVDMFYSEPMPLEEVMGIGEHDIIPVTSIKYESVDRCVGSCNHIYAIHLESNISSIIDKINRIRTDRNFALLNVRGDNIISSYSKWKLGMV